MSTSKVVQNGRITNLAEVTPKQAKSNSFKLSNLISIHLLLALLPRDLCMDCFELVSMIHACNFSVAKMPVILPPLICTAVPPHPHSLLPGGKTQIGTTSHLGSPRLGNGSCGACLIHARSRQGHLDQKMGTNMRN